jgi:lipase chaperone LimK
MKRKPVILLSGAAIIGLGLWFGATMRPAPPAGVPELPRSDPNAFVRSMEGTKPDGNIKVAANDGLIVDAELSHLFDYYLSAMGEKSLDAIKAETERELDRKLSPAAAAAAKRLFQHYLDYKRELVDVERNAKPGTSQAAAMRARFDAMQKVRGKYFSPVESSGLFALNDARDLDSIARFEVTENANLNAAQKHEQLARLDANLPQPLREEREAPLKVTRVEEQVAQLRARGGSDQDVYQLRAKAFSPEAAARLAEVDREEAQWQVRIANYLAQRQQIVQNTVNPAQQQQAIANLRAQNFSSEEQLRLPAYEPH